MILGFKLFQGNSSLLEKTGQRNFQGVVSVNSDGRNRIPFQLQVTSTIGVEIDLKCFKYIPPPPGFRLCPEAGTIKLPNHFPPQGNAQFSLPSPLVDTIDNESVKTYNINIFDFESLYNIFIHLNP